MSHLSQVLLRSIVKVWHSEHMLTVQTCAMERLHRSASTVLGSVLAAAASAAALRS